jgi:hypothetical protein
MAKTVKKTKPQIHKKSKPHKEKKALKATLKKKKQTKNT